MATKFDRKAVKQQLFHLSISLSTIVICIAYMLKGRNWTNSGRFWHSPVLPIVFIGEMLKIFLARIFECHDNEGQMIKQRRRKFSNFLGGLLLQIFCTMLYGFACIILGAPVFYYHEETFVLSLLLTLLTVSPTVFLVGAVGAFDICFCEKPDFTTKSEEIALNLFKGNALGAILGAWAGSIVAPLDWDCDWQVYPIPNTVGILIGCALFNFYAFIRILCATTKIYARKNKDQN